MGINDARIYGVAYALSAALMGIAAAVLVPFFYVHPGVGTSFLLKVFVIVVLGGIGSMPGAALGGLLVGMIEGIVGLYVQASAAQIVLFGAFIAILFVRPAGLLGVERGDAARRDHGPDPRRRPAPVALLLPLVTRALLGADEYWIQVLIWVMFFAYLSAAWNLIGGFAGQYSIGHAGLVGIGAYTSSLLLIHAGLTPMARHARRRRARSSGGRPHRLSVLSPPRRLLLAGDDRLRRDAAGRARAHRPPGRPLEI